MNLSNSLNPTSNVLNSSRSVQTLGNELSCLSEYSHESRPCSMTSKMELLEHISRCSCERSPPSPLTAVTPDIGHTGSLHSGRHSNEDELVLTDPNQLDKIGNGSSDHVRLDGTLDDNGKMCVPSKLS